MLRLTALIVLCISVIITISVSPLHAQPTGESLIQAWEKIQKSDPKVLTLEKLGDNSYKFKTEHFPFDGELRVKGVIMDDIGTRQENDYIFGTVQVELVGLPPNFLQQYSYNYSIWSRNNTLYYDKKVGNWISSKQFIDVMTNKAAKLYKSSWGISDYAMIALALVGIVIIIRISRRNKIYMNTVLQKQEEGLARSNMAVRLTEKGIQLNEETNKLLQEILEVLKSKS